jgi:hypothetical protein
MRRSIIDYCLVFLFCLLGLMFFTQVGAHFIVNNSDPPSLLIVQSFIGIIAIITAVGIWRQTRFTLIAVLIWGATFSGHIMTFIPIMPPQIRGGFWAASAIILIFTAAVLFYLRRRWKQACCARLVE